MTPSVLEQITNAPYGAPLRIQRPDAGWDFPWALPTFTGEQVDQVIACVRNAAWTPTVVIAATGSGLKVIDGAKTALAIRLMGAAYFDVVLIPVGPTSLADTRKALQGARKFMGPDGLARLIDAIRRECGYTHQRAVQLLGIPRSVASQALSWSDWPRWLCDAVTAGKLSYSAATVIWQARESLVQEVTRQWIDANSPCAVSAVKQYIRQAAASPAATRPAIPAVAQGVATLQSPTGLRCLCCRHEMSVQEIAALIVCRACCAALSAADPEAATTERGAPSEIETHSQQYPEHVPQAAIVSEKAKPDQTEAEEHPELPDKYDNAEPVK